MSGRRVTIAVATLNQWALDFDGNKSRILESVLEAKESGATFRTGPELEICGYSCEDHFYEPDTYHHSLEVLAELLIAPLCRDILMDVGLPVLHKGAGYNCRAVFLNQRLLLFKPKMYMCGDGNYREGRWFSAWSKLRQTEDYYLPSFIQDIAGQITVPIGDAVIATRDTTLGFEICEEVWNPLSSHIPLGLDGVEIICNSSGSHAELMKSRRLLELIKTASFKSGGCYIFSNMRGCDGQRYYFNGNSAVVFNGSVVAKAKEFSLEEVEVISATVDLGAVSAFRNQKRSRCHLAASSPSYPQIYVDYSLCSSSDVITHLSKPIEEKFLDFEEEIAQGPACWLWDYLRRSGQGGFFLPLSGGIDSTCSALMVYSMCRMAVLAIQLGDVKVLSDVRKITADPEYTPGNPQELCNRLLVTCYMATENSSEGTKKRAADLAKAIGSYHLHIVIDKAVSAVLDIFTACTGLVPKFSAHGGCIRQNLALQNIQARLRMVLSYLFAQLVLWTRRKPGGLLVLGSGNVDEALRGYITKYDCSSADINPIGGLNKVDLKRFLQYVKIKWNISAIEPVVAAPSTAELIPLQEGRIMQTDEEEMGMTYAELSEYATLRQVQRCGPYSMYLVLAGTWSGRCTPREVADKVKHFFRCYAINRHKMTVLTPSYHAEAYSPDDNRFDHRPFLYRANWSWQFRAIDKQVEKHNNIVKKNTSVQGSIKKSDSTTRSRTAVAV